VRHPRSRAAAESATLLAEWQPHLAILDMDLGGALFEANQSLCTEDTRLGRSAQHAVLDVPAVLERHPRHPEC
jgi:hypothetical protein